MHYRQTVKKCITYSMITMRNTCTLIRVSSTKQFGFQLKLTRRPLKSWGLQWQAKHNKRIPIPIRLIDEIFKQKEYISMTFLITTNNFINTFFFPWQRFTRDIYCSPAKQANLNKKQTQRELVIRNIKLQEHSHEASI